MRESTVITLRVLVMLTFLVVIPAIALFGTSLPQMCVSLLERFQQTDGDAQKPQLEAEEAARQEFDAAPPYNGGTAGDATPGPARTTPSLAIGAGSNSPLPPPGFAQNPGSNPVAGDMASATATASSPAGGVMGTWPPSTETVPVGYNATAHNAMATPRNTSPVETGAVFAGGNQPQGVPLGGSGQPEMSAGGGDSFNQVEQSLRARGATYWRLEAWGTSGQLYRFSCRMADPTGPQLTRHVEATAESPTEAMRKVLFEVESWRTGR